MISFERKYGFLSIFVCFMLNTLVLAENGPIIPPDVFPSLIDMYTGTVASNFNNSVQYSLSYFEAFDKVANAYMTRGRYHSSNTVELFFFQQGTVFMFDQRYPEATCSFMSWNDYPSQDLVRASVRMFDGLSALNKTYLGKTSEARGLPADKWLITDSLWLPSEGTDMQYNITVFFVHDDTPEPQRVPLRLEFVSSGLLNGAPFEQRQTTDWVNVAVGQPPQGLFRLPADCRPGMAPSTLPLPSVNTVQPPAPQMPPLPLQFTATLEAKLRTDSEQVFTVVWSMDQPHWTERFDIFEHRDANEPDSPLQVRSIIFAYEPGSDWGHEGTRFEGFMDHDDVEYAPVHCNVAPIDEHNKSPLLSLRAGSIPSVFADSDFITRARQYVGRHTARGVPADVYRDAHVHTVGDTTYEFNMDFMFFPPGWAFPGRDLNDTRLSALPLRIRNQGNMTTNQGTVPYEDVWDFYMLLPSTPPARTFDPTSIGCPAPTQRMPFGDPPSRRALILAAVLGSLAGATLIAAIGFCCWRRYRAQQPAEAETVQLKNMEDLHEFSA